MCAMMPMLRVLAKGDCLGIAVIPETTDLPAVVRERLVGFRHAVRVLALLHRAAAQVGGVEQLVGELFLHRLAVAARGGVADQPADAEREPPVRVDLDRHLIVRAADATRLHLEARLDVVDRLLEDLQRIVRGLLLDDVEALVEDPLRGAALAVAHHAVDELGDQRALVHRIRGDVALGDNSSSWHLYIPDIAECGLRIAESSMTQSIRNPQSAIRITPSLVSWRRTWTVPASGPGRRPRRASRARRDSGRPADP